MNNHPFLCGMDYVFQTPQRLYFVLPFVNGGELDRICIKRRRLEESEVKFYIAQIIIGIGKLHERGIVHRDIKLSNILVDETGYIKIIDFGLAMHLKEGEVITSISGSPKYLAPEVLTTEGANKNVDWWALGIILFEMIFGYPPFQSESRQKLSQIITSQDPVIPEKAEFGISYSDEVADLISKLLIKDQA